DDPCGESILAGLDSSIVAMGLSRKWNLKVGQLSIQESLFSMQIGEGDFRQFRSPLIGEHNIENLALCLPACSAFDLQLAGDLDRCLESLPAVPGRLERVETKNGHVFVDYAHTPDALE